jgi:signal transduction histidine kinase
MTNDFFELFTIGCVGGSVLAFCSNFFIWFHQSEPQMKVLNYFCAYLFAFSTYFIGRFALEYLFISENLMYESIYFIALNEPFQIGLHLLYLYFVAQALEITPMQYPKIGLWLRVTMGICIIYVIAHWIRVIGFKNTDVFAQAYLLRIWFVLLLLTMLYAQERKLKDLYTRYMNVGIIAYLLITAFPLVAHEEFWMFRPMTGLVFACCVQAVFFSAAIDYRLRQLDIAHQAEASRQLYEQQLLALTQLFAQKEKRLADRLQLAQDLHDDIGPMLAHIARLGDKLSKQGSTNPVTQQQTIVKMRSTISNVLKDLKELVWLLQLHDTIQKEDTNTTVRPTQTLVKRMEAVGMEWLTEAGIELSFNSTESVLVCCNHLSIRSVEHIWRIYKEAINNICRHSKASKTNVELTCDNDFLYLKIMDNGIGISAEMRNNGNGLFNMSKRAKGTGGVLTVESVEAKGTCLYFQFPCQNIIEQSVTV